MKRYTAIAIVAIAFVFAAGSAPAHQSGKPVIQMAILLDTSNSMDGLINQARTQLWKIVNEFIEAQKNGRKPDLQVALYEYGNRGLSRESGYIRQVLPLTTDLDKVSQELFALTTNGGDEYCGHVIDKASRDLDWSPSDDDLKVVFIAGNEPFTQGSLNYVQSIKAAITKGIIVNTIYCGSEEEGIRGKWKDGALLADGSYMFIDQNKAEIYIEAPQDRKLAELGEKLNETYIAYGAGGQAGAMNQAAQDTNARESSVHSAVNRAIFKSAAQYNNAAWDLVDALDQGLLKLSEMDKNDFPENMKEMAPAEQQAYVDAKRADRKRIQNEINNLNNERKAYLADRMKNSADEENDTLDSAMAKTIQSMMAKKDFRSE